MPSIDPEVEQLLTSAPVVAHLATCRDGRPHIAPVWFHYCDEVVEVVTTGRKLEDIRDNPFVSLSIERSEHDSPEWMVSLRGTATVVEDEDAFRAANARINRKYGVEDDAWDDNTLVSIDVGSASARTY